MNHNIFVKSSVCDKCKYKNLIILLCVLAGVLFLVGCGVTDSDTSVASESTDSGKTEITWWAFPVFAQVNAGDKPGTYERKLISAFEEGNPDIHVKLSMLDYTNGPEKLSLALKNNEACDILFDAPGRIVAYGEAGYLAGLDDMFDEAFTSDVQNTELINACKSGDNAYMYPLSSAPFYMAFNKRMLEEAGVLELVHEGWTTEEFTSVLEALSKAGFVPGSVYCNGTGGDQGTRAFVANLYDGTVMDDTLSEYTLGGPEGLKAMEYVLDAKEKGLILDGSLLTGTEAIENFVYGRASFTILWGPSQQNSYAGLMDTYGVQAVEVPLPSEDGVPALEYLVNGFCVMDNGSSEKIEASKRFLQFVCDDPVWGAENVIRTGCIPVRTSFGNLYGANERMEEIAGWTQYYIPYYNTVEGFADMRNAWYTGLRDMLGGYETPEDALKIFGETADQSLKNEGN